jgi:hypothetical protein
MYGGFMLTEAQRMADELKKGEPQRSAKIVDLEKRLHDLKAESASAAKADGLVSSFQSELSGEPQCPKCWIYKEVQTPVKVCLDSDDATKILRCDKCGTDYRPPYPLDGDQDG